VSRSSISSGDKSLFAVENGLIAGMMNRCGAVSFWVYSGNDRTTAS